MSGLAGLFSSSVKVDSMDFKYDPNKAKRAAQQQQQAPQFPFQAQVQLFRFDQASNANKSVGTVIFLVRPLAPSYQILAYQNQAQPFIALQVSPSINFLLRNQIYGYLTDAQNVQWTIQFPNASVAARCAVTLAAICTNSEGKTLEKFDVGVGNGAVVAPEDQVTVSYIGFLGNQLPHTQVQFDANEQYSFVIGSEKTIKGYSQGVDGMRVGGTRVIIVPPELGYGAGGVRGTIPPNSTLTFLITLKSAEQKQKAQPEPAPQAQPAPAPAPAPAAPAPAPVAAPAPVQPVQQAPPVQPAQQARPEKRERQPTTLERLQRQGALAAVPGMGKPVEEDDDDSQSDFEEPAMSSARGFDSGRRQAGLFDDDSQARGQMRGGIPTMDQKDMLERIEQLNELLKAKFDLLAESTPVTMKPGDVVYEVQALAAEIEEKDRQLREQQRVIDDLRRTKQNSRLRSELDIAQTELQSLRAVLKGGRDFRRENDELKQEVKQLKEARLAKDAELASLRKQLADSREQSRQAAENKTKELIYSFIGATMDRLNAKIAGKKSLTPKEITTNLYDIFQVCSDDAFKQLSEN